MGQRWKRPELLEQNRLCPHGISACVISWVTQMIHGSCSGRFPFSPWVRGTELLLSAAEGRRLLDDDFECMDRMSGSPLEASLTITI